MSLQCLIFELMEIIFGHGSHNLKGAPCVMTLGNFDGMHVGHESLVRRVKILSEEQKILGGLMTFEPHPLKVLAPEKQTKSIFDLSEKKARVKALGLDFFVIEPFSRELSELDGTAFLDTLVNSFHLKELVVGHDFNFGKNRSGTLEVLKNYCHTKSIALEILPPVTLNNEVVSSTKIRQAVAEGEIEKANLFLGRPFFLDGVIERGAARGRTIGFPTANLFTKAELIPKDGVYVTFFNCKSENHYSVTNVGQNPTFKESAIRPTQIETYILDFDEEIYGEQVRVSFLKYLRPEKKFSSVDQLIEAIKTDVKVARAYSWPKK